MEALAATLKRPRALATAGVVVAALHLLLLALLDAPPFAADAVAYDEMAKSFARGEPWLFKGQEQTAWMPGYPTFVGLWYALFGASPLAVRAVQALMVGLDAVLMYVVARRLVGPRFAPLGFLFFALSPVFVLYQAALAAENLAITLVLLYLEALTAELPTAPRGQVLWAIRFGLVGGVLCFTRAEYSVWMAAIPLILLGRVGLKKVVGLTAIAATVVALCLAPWVIRNARAHGQLIVFTTLSGRALWQSAQMPEQTEVGSASFVAIHEQCKVNPRPKEFDNCLAADARRAIKDHPGYYLKTSLMRAARTVVGSHTEFLANNAQSASFRQALAEGRWGLLAFKALSFLFHGALVVLGAAGLWRHRASRVWQIIAGAIAYKVVVHALLFGTPRYGVPLQPLFLLGALGLAVPPLRQQQSDKSSLEPAPAQ